ncbi:MAG: hypothetical protein ABI361_05385 [Nitrososphaera sp.]
MSQDIRAIEAGPGPLTPEQSQSLLQGIDSLVDQAIQIYELNSREGEIIASIGSSISILLNTLKVSLPLSQKIFQNEFPGVKSTILNNKAEIIIMQSNGNIITKEFSDLDSKQVMDIMTEIVPKLRQNAEETKADVMEKMGMLKKMAKQLQRVKGINNTTPTSRPPNSQEDDQ